MRGWWNMHCWNGLSPEQQAALMAEGVIPVGMWPTDEAVGPCRNGAEVEVTTIWDAAPGPRFYCLSCAVEYLLDVTTVTLCSDNEGGSLSS